MKAKTQPFLPPQKMLGYISSSNFNSSLHAGVRVRLRLQLESVHSPHPEKMNFLPTNSTLYYCMCYRNKGRTLCQLKASQCPACNIHILVFSRRQKRNENFMNLIRWQWWKAPCFFCQSLPRTSMWPSHAPRNENVLFTFPHVKWTGVPSGQWLLVSLPSPKPTVLVYAESSCLPKILLS